MNNTKQCLSLQSKVLQLLLILIFSLFTFQTSLAQNILWEKSCGGDKVEYLFDAIPTKDYGFLLAGSSLSIVKGINYISFHYF